MIEERIEAYIIGDMEPELRQRFENQLLSDPKLADEVQLYESMIEGIKDRGRERLKMRFLQLEYQLLENEDFESIQPEDPSFISHLKWAVGLMILIIPLIYYLIPSKNPEQIFNSYFEPFENTHVVYRTNPDSASIYDQAFMAYENREYKEAVRFFQRLEKNSTDGIAIPFFLAMSYLANGQAERAQSLYWSLLMIGEHEFLEPAHWYLALSFVKQNQIEEAQRELKKILEFDGEYKEQASRLLQRL